MAAGFARGEYLLWLGSGISRDVVPGVGTMIQRLLEFLQIRVTTCDPEGHYARALAAILDVAGVPQTTKDLIDFSDAVSTWPRLEDTLERLVDRYSDVLGVHVPGEAADFLVWDGLDVRTTYGSPGLAPDVEHLCIAILMMEGFVRSAPTTNWDGLVEAAVAQLSGGKPRLLNVVVRASDFTAPLCRAELLKFHGCALRAAADPGEYRDRIIARRTQIDSWSSDPENQMMRNHLENLFVSRPALVLGLSAQDPDIHAMLHRARGSLARSWPADPPAVVFAEQELHRHHRAVLGATYGDTAYAADSQNIEESALLGAFAKPVLVSLVLYGLTHKLCAVIHASGVLNGDAQEIERLCGDLRSLRDHLATTADSDLRTFTNKLASVVTTSLGFFRSGTVHANGTEAYEPLSIAPVDESLMDPDFPMAALARLAMAVSLFARGLKEGTWTVTSGSLSGANAGTLRVGTAAQTSRVFIVKDARSHSQLELSGLVDPDDSEVLVLQAEAVTLRSTRSPRARYGRTGTSAMRSVDLEAMCSSVDTADELFEAFRLEGAL